MGLLEGEVEIEHDVDEGLLVLQVQILREEVFDIGEELVTVDRDPQFFHRGEVFEHVE